MVERLFLAVPRGCLQFVIVVFPDHTHLLFLKTYCYYKCSVALPQGAVGWLWYFLIMLTYVLSQYLLRLYPNSLFNITPFTFSDASIVMPQTLTILGQKNKCL